MLHADDDFGPDEQAEGRADAVAVVRIGGQLEFVSPLDTVVEQLTAMSSIVLRMTLGLNTNCFAATS
jgi:hypothetical protein